MYANPLEPIVCPLLLLSRYIIDHPSILTGQSHLLEGHSQYEKFNKIFNEFVRTHQYEFGCLCISVRDFRTHSIRKGEATFLATCSTVSPPMASICLHANWELWEVKNRYIKYRKARYQCVGRAVTGLPILKNSSQCPFLTLIFRNVKNDYEK